MKIKRALISVSNKTGIVPFARRLSEMGIEIVSTGGTATLLRKESVPHIEIEKFTGFPEILSGRVKTLHPMVHGGLLYLRDSPEHQRQAAENKIEPIDLIVVNLYPFESTIARPDVTLEEAVEQIDIGGPSMLRSAAKNFRSVTVVTDPSDYSVVLEEIEQHGGETTLALREQFANKTFLTTARYDQLIANFLRQEQNNSGSYTLSLPMEMRLRYGENPHQSASLFGHFQDYFQKLHGKELSYNNILDIHGAA